MLIFQLKNNLTKTTIHLKNIAPHIKLPLILWCLSWFSTYLFITNCGLNMYVYILEIVLDILDKVVLDSQNTSGCLTLTAMHIKLTSLIMFLINNNLTNTSKTPPPEGKNNTVYSTFNNFMYFNKNFHLLGV